MSIKTLTLRASALALFTTVALVATAPASAATAAEVAAVRSSTTDLSAARRHHRYYHHVRRSTTVRNSYGAYEGGMPVAPAQSWNNYGYGIGDNSRNQTW